ncbi:MAG: FAD-dependent oxidoreductase [Phycisphaerales bacterium]
MSAYDAAVIGAGPAGALAALRLVRSGVRTLLVDKATFPRHKVCGCCLAPAGQAVLARCGAESALEDAARVERLDVRHASGRVHARTPLYRVIDRATMDARLVDLARDAGCVVRFGAGAVVTDDGVSIDGDPVRTRIVLCADGLGGSSLRDRAGFGWAVRRASRIGVGCVVDRVEGDGAGAITMCVGDDGYCGVARLADGRAVIAAALAPDAVRTSGVRTLVHDLLASGGVRADMADATLRGAPALTRTRCGLEDGARVFVVGDAAGYVEPFTGEGMSWALRAGERVRDHALAALGGVYEDGTWTRAVLGERRGSTAGCRAVTYVLRRPMLTSLCARVARVSPGLASMVTGRVVGRVAAA